MSKAKVGDVTGRQREEQIKSVAEQQAQRATELSMATQAAAYEAETEIVDATTPKKATTTVVDDVESVGVELNDEFEVIRVAEDIQAMTIGAGNNYDFKAGKKYKVAKHVAAHLKEKGYVYDRA